MPDEKDMCDCEAEGAFNVGVPGVVAVLEVERCDQCEKFATDDEADQHIRRMLLSHADMLVALKWIVGCASIRGPVGTTAYLVSDEQMAAAHAAIARAEGRPA